MVGKKVVMAVTGTVLILFVIAHMLGNLKIFSGPDQINAYSRFLREVGMPELAYGQLLWAVRIILLACVALHITAAVQLSGLSWAARPVAYACIGCGDCVAACPNAFAMFLTSAKVIHLNSLPHGQPQRDERTLSIVATMGNEVYGSCTNHGECEAVCPKTDSDRVHRQVEPRPHSSALAQAPAAANHSQCCATARRRRRSRAFSRRCPAV